MSSKKLRLAVVLVALAGIAAVVAAGVGGGSPDEDAATAAGASASSAADGDERPETTEATDDSEVPIEAFAVEQLPGDPRAVSISALQDRFSASLPPSLIDPGELLSGGPPPDGIPPIDDPKFERASEVTWLADTEPVLVVVVEDEARAYPVQVMTWHEIVNDTFGSTPVTVSYCPLCNSAIVYVRSIGDQTFDFGTSGMLFNSSLIMYDRQSESLWSHFTGQAVIGELTGLTLTTIPSTISSWGDFTAEYPDSLVLSRDTGFRRDYGRNPYPGYDDVDSNPFLFRGEVDGRLAAQTRVLAIQTEGDAVAIQLDTLTESGVVSFDLEGDPLIAFHRAGTASGLEAGTVSGGRDVGTTGVFDLRIDDIELSFVPNGDGEFVDDQTGSTWNIFGRAIDGSMAGAELEPVEHLDTFWFAIAAFRPDTRIL